MKTYNAKCHNAAMCFLKVFYKVCCKSANSESDKLIKGLGICSKHYAWGMLKHFFQKAWRESRIPTYVDLKSKPIIGILF